MEALFIIKMAIRATGDQCGVRVARNTTLVCSVSFLLRLSLTNSIDIGGHASQEIELSPNAEIEKIQVNRGANNAVMDGVRMYLSNGTVAGELNADGNSNVFTLGMSIV